MVVIRAAGAKEETKAHMKQNQLWGEGRRGEV